MLAASFAVASVSACETRTPGYWKNHPDAWPTITSTDSRWDLTPNFEFTMDPENAMDILLMPVKGDARINLQQKVIAASLSILNDPNIGWDNDPRYGGATDLPALVAQANELLASNADQWTPAFARLSQANSDIRANALDLASQIDGWLNFFDIG